MADASPAFLLYLAALALLGFRWLSPIGSLYEHADWSDLLVGVSAVLWLISRLRRRSLRSVWRSWMLPLVVYLALGLASAAQAVPGRGGSAKTVLLMAELAVLAVLSADFAADATRRRLIARTVIGSTLVTLGLAAIGLLLFYLGIHSGLIGSYGEQYVPSSAYARVQAGFESPPLLASFCIFAAGLAASGAAALTPRMRRGCQILFGVLCAATLSRGLIAYLSAAAIRAGERLPVGRRRLLRVGAVTLALALLAALTVGRLHLDPTRPSTTSYTVPDPGNRREAFVTSWHTFEAHPWLGIGPGALPGVNAGAPFRAHFTPLNIAATQGLPALLALAATIWLIWRDRRRPTDLALWSALVGVGLDGLAQDIDHFRHVWVLLGLLGA